MNAKQTASPILRAALSRDFNATAANFALSVVARQTAFCLASKGFKKQTTASDTNGAPKTDEAPVFDVGLDSLPGVDFTEKARPFPVEIACRLYAATLVLLSEHLKVPLEYGRLPDDGPDGLRRYWSTPGQWAAEKADYRYTLSDRECAELGATYGATAEAINAQQKARRDEINAECLAVAKNMSAIINQSVRELKNTDTDDLIDIIEESLPDIGLSGDAELAGAADAFMKSRREAFAAGKKSKAPQPGMLAMFHALGVKVA